MQRLSKQEKKYRDKIYQEYHYNKKSWTEIDVWIKSLFYSYRQAYFALDLVKNHDFTSKKWLGLFENGMKIGCQWWLKSAFWDYEYRQPRFRIIGYDSTQTHDYSFSMRYNPMISFCI